MARGGRGAFYKVARIAISFALLSQSLAHAAPAAKNSSKAPAPAARTDASLTLLPEALSAKSLLEELLARRYAQELTTLVDRSAFSVSAKLELVERPKEVEPVTPEDDNELPADLMLGTLDPEKILKKYAGEEDKRWAAGFLRNYRISSVGVSVGLKEELEAEVKPQIEKWLQERLKNEFGGVGKGSVSSIKGIKEKAPPPKTPLDWLNQYQGIIGQLVLAFALLLGILLWKLMVSRDVLAEKGASPPTVASVPPPAPEARAEEQAKNDPELQGRKLAHEESERVLAAREVRQISRRLQGLLPQLSVESEKVLRAWCRTGEDGWLKLACFAEAVGSTVGKLPIPMDSLEGLTKVFARMPEFALSDKLHVLRKVYWDLLATLNLGSEALEQPFGYLSQVDHGRVDQLLLAQNPKMKAIVTLFMPSKVREDYLGILDLASKREMLNAAFQMSEIPSSEIKSFDQLLKGQVTGGASTAGAIALRPLLSRLVEPLSPLDEIQLLSSMRGDSIEAFKRVYPTLAFVDQWPDASLNGLMGRATPEEVIALVRVRPELQERILQCCPPITSQVAGDDLSRPDALSDKQKNSLLKSLKGKVLEMIQGQELNLETIYPKLEPPTPIRAEANEDPAQAA